MLRLYSWTLQKKAAKIALGVCEKAFGGLGSGFIMSVSRKKIVTLIPSATEIVAFLGEKKSIIGR